MLVGVQTYKLQLNTCLMMKFYVFLCHFAVKNDKKALKTF